MSFTTHTDTKAHKHTFAHSLIHNGILVYCRQHQVARQPAVKQDGGNIHMGASQIILLLLDNVQKFSFYKRLVSRQTPHFSTA